MQSTKIKYYRNLKGIGQTKLANLANTPQTTLSGWEKGVPEEHPVIRAILLSKVLNISVEDLFPLPTEVILQSKTNNSEIVPLIEKKVKKKMLYVRRIQQIKLLSNPEYDLYEKDGQPFCDSLMIAETFEKTHSNVLRGTKNLGCSAKFKRLNFDLTGYKDGRNRSQRRYIMSKDGFALKKHVKYPTEVSYMKNKEAIMHVPI